MLNSPKLQQIVMGMKAGGDNRIIIFDLPPMLAWTDTQAFSSQADAALLVIDDGVTTKPDLERAIAMPESTNIAGAV